MNNNHVHNAPVSENTAICPVMTDMVVDKDDAEKWNRVREFNGKKYYLCCYSCVVDFESNPEQYAK